MVQKNKLIKTLFLFFCILILFTSYPIYSDDLEQEEVKNIFSEIQNEIAEASSSTTNSTLNLNSRSCVVIDRLSKTILYGKNEKKKVKMASTTKIMTAIVVLENSSLDKTVEVSKKAAGTGGSRLGLKTGDKISIRDLMYGLMLCSGNDAAVCLAEHVGGSIEGFSELMNTKAQTLGLSNTHFESPHGLDSDQHYTTAYELALLSDYALKNTTFLSIVGTKNYTVTINGRPKSLSNTNELLGNLNGVYGIKTGFTNGANRCLVTACKRGEMDIICVVLGADTKSFRTKDSIKLIEYSFNHFNYFNQKQCIQEALMNWNNNHTNYFTIQKGTTNQLTLKVEPAFESSPFIPLPKELIPDIETSISVNGNLIAPIHKNDVIGQITLSSQGKEIVKFDLLSDTHIAKNNIINYLSLFFKNYPNQLEKTIENML